MRVIKIGVYSDGNEGGGEGCTIGWIFFTLFLDIQNPIVFKLCVSMRKRCRKTTLSQNI